MMSRLEKTGVVAGLFAIIYTIFTAGFLVGRAYGAEWLDPAYQHRIAITAQPADTDEIVLVFDRATVPALWDDSAGNDLRITSSDGTTLLWHFAHDFAGGSQVWFAAPTVGDGVFYLYYGNPDAPHRNSNSDTFASFDVMFLYEIPPVAFIDYTAKHNPALMSGPWQFDHLVKGITGNAWQYATGRTTGIRPGQITEGVEWTVTTFAKVEGIGTDFIGQWNPHWTALAIQASDQSHDTGQVVDSFSTPDGWSVRTTKQIDQEWHRHAWITDDRNPGIQYNFDGQPVQYLTQTTKLGQELPCVQFVPRTIGSNTDPTPTGIGSTSYNDTPDGFDGRIDNYGIRSWRVSDIQLAVEFANQSSPGAFWTVGSIQTRPTSSDDRPDSTATAKMVGDRIIIVNAMAGEFASRTVWTGTHIDTAQVGSSPDAMDGFRHLFEGFHDVDKISNERAWSGPNSIHTRLDKANEMWESTLQWVSPEPFQKLYATWWVYMDPITVDPLAETQWKMFRINSNFTGWSDRHKQKVTPVNDIQSDFYWLPYFGPSGQYSRSGVDINCLQDCQPWYGCWERAQANGYTLPADRGIQLGVTRGTRDMASYAPKLRGWSRVEVYADSGTIDNADGSLRISVQHEGQLKATGLDLGQLMFLSSKLCRNETQPWRTLIFQNMFDSNGSAPHVERADIFMDDLAIQTGTQARVEIGNAPAYADCTRLEYQPVLLWEDGQIECELNLGRFTDEPLWAFVVGDNGVAGPGIRLEP